MDEHIAQKYNNIFLGQKVNGFEIVDYVGIGKSGIVFKGKDKSNSPVAIKIIDNQLVFQFGATVQEQRMERQLELKGHSIANLVKILDGGQLSVQGNDYYYLVMEYIDGLNLKEFIKKHGAQGEEFSRSILEQLYSATETLFELNVVHRDIKPENVMIDNQTTITLMDLGVVKKRYVESGTDSAEEKRFVSTLRYAPPELLFREEENSIDAWRAINLYQIGGVLHDVMMGYELFAQYSTPYSRLIRAVEQETPSLERNDYGLSFCHLVRNMLSKNWQDRLNAISEFKQTDTWKACESEASETLIKQMRESNLPSREKMARIDKKAQVVSRKRMKQKDMINLIRTAIVRCLDWIKDEGIYRRYSEHSLAPRTDRRGVHSSFLFEFVGNLEQGFCEHVYVLFTVSLDDHESIVIELVGLVPGLEMNFDDPTNRPRMVLSKMAKAKRISVFSGVYHSSTVLEQLKTGCLRLITEAQSFMSSFVEADIDFRGSGVDETKAISRTSSARRTFLIQDITDV